MEAASSSPFAHEGDAQVAVERPEPMWRRQAAPLLSFIAALSAPTVIVLAIADIVRDPWLASIPTLAIAFASLAMAIDDRRHAWIKELRLGWAATRDSPREDEFPMRPSKGRDVYLVVRAHTGRTGLGPRSILNVVVPRNPRARRDRADRPPVQDALPGPHPVHQRPIRERARLQFRPRPLHGRT